MIPVEIHIKDNVKMESRMVKEPLQRMMEHLRAYLMDLY